MKRVLFLCTGNYYRSRFAEELFNHLAPHRNLDWVAESRGLRVRPDGSVNVGPLSFFAAAGLEERAIKPVGASRFPQQVTDADFESAQHVIALKEAEHRPLMQALFPHRIPQVTFWHIHDIDAASPVAAMKELEQQVRQLIDQLAAMPA